MGDRKSAEWSGAGDGVRTRDIQLGKLTLCQLSYSRSEILRSAPFVRQEITATYELRPTVGPDEIGVVDRRQGDRHSVAAAHTGP
jgi:hypothetical protein